MLPLKLEVLSTTNVKTKKYWRTIQWDDQLSENICLFGRRTVAQLNLITGKKKRVDASIRKLLGKVVCISSSTCGDCVAGLLQDGRLFRWRKNTRTITNISPCPEHVPMTGETINKDFKRPKIFIADDGNTILLFSRQSGMFVWRSAGFDDSGWTRIGIGNSATGLLSAQHTAVDAVFYNDKVHGSLSAFAFPFFTDENLAVGVLSLKLGQPHALSSYHRHIYPTSDFDPPCFAGGRRSLIPCWSRNGKILAVAINQRTPARAKVVFIQPNTGGIINVGFEKVLKGAVDMSFWISNMTWTCDNLHLISCTKQGAVFVISAAGILMQITAESAVENFGPGIFLSLEGLVDFRRPAPNNLGHELEESTDTSIQSTIVPPKQRKPNFSVNAHPSLPILLCGDGHNVAAIKMINLTQPHDFIVLNINAVIAKLSNVIKRYNLQVTVYEPISYFSVISDDDNRKLSDNEERWRHVIKSVHENILRGNYVDTVNVNDTDIQTFEVDTTNTKADLSVGEQLSATMQSSNIGLLTSLSRCCSDLLSSLAIFLMTSEERCDVQKSTVTENDDFVNGFTERELHNLYLTTLKMFTDILLQLQEVADILPVDENMENEASLRTQMCDTVHKLGIGILKLLPWNGVTKTTSALVPMAVNEIVNTLLICSRKSSEGCLNYSDVQENLHRTFLFLMKAESLMSKLSCSYHNVNHSDILSTACPASSPRREEENASVDYKSKCCCSEQSNIYFPLAWKTFANYISMMQTVKLGTRDSALFNSLSCFVQSMVGKRMITTLHDIMDDDVTMATKNLIHMCNSLSKYDFCNAMSSSHKVISSILINIEKQTDEKWLPVEILASVMTSYFCGTDVEVPSYLTALARCAIENSIPRFLQEYNLIETAYCCTTRLQQQLIVSAIRKHSLDESWNIDNAVLLLLSCGLVEKAAEVAHRVGDWRTSLVLSAVFGKTSFCKAKKLPGTTQIAAKTKIINVETILRYRLCDVMSSVLKVKVETNAEKSFFFSENDDRNFVDISPTLYTKCFADVYKFSVMVGVDMTTWPLCSLLEYIKTRCRNSGIPLEVSENFNLPNPQLYLPQSVQNSKNSEAKLRTELSAIIRTIMTIFHSIGISRIVAHWFLKWLKKESKCQQPHHGSNVEPENLLNNETFLKDVAMQGLEINLDHMHSNSCDEDIYILAAIFREICTILWIFHVRDKLSTAFRRYQDIRERQAVQKANAAIGAIVSDPQIPQKDVDDKINECIFWLRKLRPFAKFMRFESDLTDFVLCLASELPMNADTVSLVAEFYHAENTIPKNKHRLQVMTEKMRKSQITVENSEEDNNTTLLKPLSTVFNEKCKQINRDMKAKKTLYSDYGTPIADYTDIQSSNDVLKSVATGDSSQYDTLTREETSRAIEVTPKELLKTLGVCYSFESDNMYHAYVLEFLEIFLSKTPPSASFTPKKERKSRNVTSRPLTYPLVLTYRNEIAKAELDMVPPISGYEFTPIVIKIPVAKNDNEPTERGHDLQHNGTCDSVIGEKFIPRVNLDQASAHFCKRLQRLVPYFSWLEHWRSESVIIPQARFIISEEKKLALRISTNTECFIHGYTVAELRFGKNMKSKNEKKSIMKEDLTSEASSIISDTIDGKRTEPKVSLLEDNVTITGDLKKSASIDETKPHITHEQVCDVSQRIPQHKSLQDGGDQRSVSENLGKSELKSPHQSQQQLSEKTMVNESTDTNLQVEDLHSEVPQPSTGKLLREVMREEEKMSEGSILGISNRTDTHRDVTVASQSSTGLQSDVLADGGGKIKRSRLSSKKEHEKMQMKQYVQNEIQSVIVQQQVFLLAHILQSVASHASSYQIPSNVKPIRPVQVQDTKPPTLQPRKFDGKLKILSLDGQNSYIVPSSKDPMKVTHPRVPLKILTENNNFRTSKTVLLQDEKAFAPKMFTTGKSMKKQSTHIPVMYDDRKRPVYPDKTLETVTKHDEDIEKMQQDSKLTPEMLHDSKFSSSHHKPKSEDTCPTCHSHNKPKSAPKLPLLSLAGPIPDKVRQQAYQQREPIPRLVGLGQVLHYEQKRMETTKQQSKSIRHIGQNFPLLDASNIPGFYRVKPKFSEVPMMRPSSQLKFQTPTVTRSLPEETGGVPVTKKDAKVHFEEPRIPIPSELLPRILSSDEVDKIRNGVLSHYNVISEQQKAMLREAGQQTDAVESDHETEVIENSEHSVPSHPRLLKKGKKDQYEMHQDFTERFLRIETAESDRSRTSDAGDLNSNDVALTREREMRSQVPATQKLVKSRWSSAMDQMSSEMDVIGEMDRDIQSRYELDIPESVVTHVKPPIAMEHMLPQGRDVHTSHSVHSRSRSLSPTTPRSTSTHQVFREIGSRISQERLTPANIHRKAQFEQDFMSYRRTIDEALNLADQRLSPTSGGSRMSSLRPTPSSSMHKIDETLSSLSWNELEAMITDSVLMDAEMDTDGKTKVSSVDGRIQDALQLLNELQTDQIDVDQNKKKSPAKQIVSKKSRKRNADVDARIQDAVSLLDEIKSDQRQVIPGKRTKKVTIMQTGKTKPKAVDNWTMDAMSLLKELKTELEPENRISYKENMSQNVLRKTDSDDIRAHLEEAMALLNDDNSSKVSFEPVRKYY